MPTRLRTFDAVIYDEFTPELREDDIGCVTFSVPHEIHAASLSSAGFSRRIDSSGSSTAGEGARDSDQGTVICQRGQAENGTCHLN